MIRRLKYASTECWWHKCVSACVCVRVKEMQVRPQLGSNREIKPTQAQADPEFTLSFLNLSALRYKNKMHASTKHTSTQNIQIQRNVAMWLISLVLPRMNEARHSGAITQPKISKS